MSPNLVGIQQILQFTIGNPDSLPSFMIDPPIIIISIHYSLYTVYIMYLSAHISNVTQSYRGVQRQPFLSTLPTHNNNSDNLRYNFHRLPVQTKYTIFTLKFTQHTLYTN